MTARHVYVDETKRRGYVMAAAAVLGDDLTPTRAVVQSLLMPGQHHLHMKDESDGRKETIAAAFALASLWVTVYDAGGRHRNQMHARAACLHALVEDIAASSSETLIVLDQDDTLVHSDRQLLYRSVRAVGREHQVRYEHRRSDTELLLGIPDAFAWCWAKGGRWRSLIQPVVRVVEV